MKDLNAQISFFQPRFFPRVELSAPIDILSTSEALHWEWRHESHGLNTRPGLLRASATGDIIRIKVWGVVFLSNVSSCHVAIPVCSSSYLKDFAFRHCVPTLY